MERTAGKESKVRVGERAEKASKGNEGRARGFSLKHPARGSRGFRGPDSLVRTRCPWCSERKQ